MGTEEPRPAFYALRAGGWRDYVTVLHLPYTAWNLSYVALGAALAPRFRTDRMLWTMAAFALGARRRGPRPRRAQRPTARDRDPGRRLVGLGVASLAGACAIGIWAATRWGYGLLAFVAAGAFIVPAYNLEWFGGRFHGALVARARLGRASRPQRVLRAGRTLRVEAILAAGYATALILVQRTLSTPVRHARRRSRDLAGRRADGAGAADPAARERAPRRRARGARLT